MTQAFHPPQTRPEWHGGGTDPPLILALYPPLPPSPDALPRVATSLGGNEVRCTEQFVPGAPCTLYSYGWRSVEWGDSLACMNAPRHGRAPHSPRPAPPPCSGCIIAVRYTFAPLRRDTGAQEAGCRSSSALMQRLSGHLTRLSRGLRRGGTYVRPGDTYGVVTSASSINYRRRQLTPSEW
ncbi:hypothetical protein DAEQUDRAFT_726809 [Daedalea quercina L-15889]|uniref:Uncharacterized protein n=1 Tax=Daedalea quercina L-15889 TaxID=1314783 RepID=A0A165QAV1_9APHY|nr:hypothetical protein DAEQUDRAFT_726809 [Daedalea quercina L-15889]